ncbi:MAG TPA: phage holin family protein [Acidimicrobiia bacterium]|nr:phage holin family protein [Acidimicrobiia bacterium]
MPESRPLPEVATELWELVVAYVKQETVTPLKQLGRYVAFGTAGALLLGAGVVFCAMSALRALQTETGDTFTGNWTWLPYLIVTSALLVGAGLSWLARGRRKART